MASAVVKGIDLEEKSFMAMLREVIGHTKSLQNHPPSKVPNEDLVADRVLQELAPYSGDSGPLQVKKITYVAGRSNVIVTYPGTTDAVVSFVGSHMDVVPANPEEWKRDPFELVQEGDQLFGRGVTDCLGHVCMLTNFFKQLAIAKPALRRSVVAVFIANEENSSQHGIGIDELVKQGELTHLKRGPLFWIDSANFGPTLGTGGMMVWQLTVSGKKFHSGLPQNGINAIELGMEVVRHIQTRFYEDFTRFAADEKEYKFQVGSSMKPTQISTPPGSVNQIPGTCTISGDIRHTPFYTTEEVQSKIAQYVDELDVTALPSLGSSKYHLPDEGLRGAVELKWLGHAYKGIAVDLKSPGYAALSSAVETVCGKCEPFSLTGSLPIIRDLQEEGFDVQITGFGKMEAYHANDEYGYLSDFKKGIKVVAHAVAGLE